MTTSSPIIHALRAMLATIAIVIGLCSTPAAVVCSGAAIVAAGGCAATPEAQVAAIDSTIASYERSVMRLHQSGVVSDEMLFQAHAYSLAAREALDIYESAPTPQTRRRALDIAQDKLGDLAQIVQHAGGEPPGTYPLPLFR